MTYYFKIQARNSKGYGPFSTTYPFKTPQSMYLILINVCTYNMIFFSFKSLFSVMYIYSIIYSIYYILICIMLVCCYYIFYFYARQWYGCL